jgi:IPTL-CTERM motif
VGSVTGSLLANFDVFFIGYLDDANVNAFTPAELSAMQAWVNGGGTMIITCDDSNYDAVCASFGHPATGGSPGINPIVPTAAGSAHALFNGPFGTVTAINEVGTRGAFTSTTGATVLAQDSTPGTPLPVVLVQQIGAGRVVFLADVDLIANGLSAGATITNQNDQFLGNLFAFVGGFAAAPAPVLQPVPALSPANLALLALAIAAMAIGMRRRIARR